MMQARVDVQRALNAYQACQRNAARLGQQARASAEYAVRCWPADPVPWVALLTLAQVDTVEIRQRRPEHRMSPWERPLPPGPWGLLYDVCRRDPLNREGWHRMLQALQAYREPTSDFVRWVSSRAPEGSPSALLPLYAYVDVYRSRRSGGLPTPLYWRSDPVPYYARSALTRWFAHADRTSWSPVDLNYLAHALSASGIAEGAEVFEAIGTRVTPAPWKYVSDVPEQWQETFLAARRHYVPDATGGPLHARPRR
nr:hypothetical protein OH820_15295 [Streptomyces sp. NBC_00857]